MKTLDEVISALEENGDFVAECSYCSANYCDKSYRMAKCYTGDALYYLKEYQKKKKTLEIKAAEYKRGFEQLGVDRLFVDESHSLNGHE